MEDVAGKKKERREIYGVKKTWKRIEKRDKRK